MPPPLDDMLIPEWFRCVNMREGGIIILYWIFGTVYKYTIRNSLSGCETIWNQNIWLI